MVGPQRGRPRRRGRAGHGDGRGRGGHRPHDPSRTRRCRRPSRSRPRRWRGRSPTSTCRSARRLVADAGRSILQPSASYSITMRVRLPQRPGSFGLVASAIGHQGGILGAIDLVRVEGSDVVRDITVSCVDAAHGEAVVGRGPRRSTASASRASRTGRSSCTCAARSPSTAPSRSRRATTSRWPTRRASRACRRRSTTTPRRAWNLTVKGNTVAVVTDGTAVLGLGDIGPEAAMPVMEGKALLFKEFAGVDAYPLCLATKDVDEIVAVVKAVSPTFGGINLEDISAPRCFEIERRLRAELDIPVFHDDQHGTAIVLLAALLNALRVVDKRAEDVRVVVTGAGRGGHRVHGHPARAGRRRDRRLRPVRRDPPRSDRPRSGRAWRWPSARTRATAAGRPTSCSRARTCSSASRCPARCRRRRSARWRTGRSSSRWPTRRPRCSPRRSAPTSRSWRPGGSDYPNQINNVLAFPGVFRGALDARATTIDERHEARRRGGDRAVDPGGPARARVHRAERLQPRGRAARRAGGRARPPRRSGVARRPGARSRPGAARR